MMNQSNPYEKLLDYLQNQDIPKSKTKIKKVNINRTKQVIEESKIHSYIPEKRKNRHSNGFNVDRFESMMRTKLIEEFKKIQSYERPYISVTELCSCLRECYYARMKFPINNSLLFKFPYVYLIQKVGNSIHTVIQNIYNFSEVEKTVVSEKYKVKGRVDGIRDIFLFEIKTIDLEKFKNKYIDEHFYQSNIYAYILNSEYNYNITTVTIVYVTRNLKRIIPFDVPVNRKVAKSFLNRALILKSSLQSHQVPDPIGSTNEHCKFCLYIDQCKKDACNEVFQAFKKSKEKIKNEKQNKVAFLL